MARAPGALPLTESAYYEADAHWHAERFDDREEQQRLAACAALIPAVAASVLDVGAGQGAFLRWLEEHHPVFRLAGIERAQSAINVAVCETRISLGDISALPNPDRSFDVVTALEVLEHLPFSVYDAGRAEMARVADMAIIISVPFAERRALVECPECGCRFHPNYHMRSFEPSSFPFLFEGFRLDRMETLYYDDYIGGPLLRWGYRTLRGGANEIQPGSLCPQCGYRGEQPSSARLLARRQVKGRLPKRRRPRWLVGRFMRA
jgi:SAM-dependent methyltransferase